MFVSLAPPPAAIAAAARLPAVWLPLEAVGAGWLEVEAGVLPGAFRFFDVLCEVTVTLGFAEKVDMPGI